MCIQVPVSMQNIAMSYVIDFLNTVHTRSFMFQGKKQKVSTSNCCVFLDIDGTILSNEISSTEILKQFYDNNNDQLASAAASPSISSSSIKVIENSNTYCVRFLHNIFKRCNELNIKVFIITAREDNPRIRAYTKEQLQQCGYYERISDSVGNRSSSSSSGSINDNYYEKLIMMPKKDRNAESASSTLTGGVFNFSRYKYNSRVEVATKGSYLPLLSIGDQWYDIVYVPPSPSSWHVSLMSGSFGENVLRRRDEQRTTTSSSAAASSVVNHDKYIETLMIKQNPKLNRQEAKQMIQAYRSKHHDISGSGSASDVNNTIYVCSGIDITWISVKLPPYGVH